MNHITAKEAREMAFNKVKTTYDECLNRFMDAVFENIEKSAKEGKLDIYMSLDELVDTYFEGIKSDGLFTTLKDVINERLSSYGFKVEYVGYNVSPGTMLIVNW